MHRLPHFLTHGAPLRALRARESSAVKTASKQVWLWFAEPRGGDTQALPQIFRLCWIPKKISFKSSHPKKYLPKFPTQKNPGREDFYYPRHLRSLVRPLSPGPGFLKISLLRGQKYSIQWLVCINFKGGSRCRNQYPLAFPLSDERKIHKGDYASKYSNKGEYTWSNPVPVLPCRLEQGQKSIGTPQGRGCW